MKTLNRLAFYGNHYGRYLRAMVETGEDDVMMKELTSAMNVSRAYIYQLYSKAKFKKIYLYRAADVLRLDISADFPDYEPKRDMPVVNEPASPYNKQADIERKMFGLLKEYLAEIARQEIKKK